MKKLFNFFMSIITSFVVIGICVLFSSCDQLNVEQTKTVTVEKQRNQKLFMFNSAQAQDLNILILPEAYTKDEMNDFVADASKLYSVLCKTSPYSYLMDKMNIWYAAGYPSESDELGSKKTAFGSGKPKDCVLSIEEDSVLNAVNLAKLKAENTIVVILVNTDEYVGYTILTNGDNPNIAVIAARDDYYATTIIHELGHAIGLLADEYDDNKVATESIISTLGERHRDGFYLNVSSSAEDFAWKMIIEDEEYESEGTGVYVGAYCCSSGMFRSTLNSAMRSNLPYYNAISRLRIYQEIMKRHTGTEPSYYQFRIEDLAHPASEWDWKSANQNRQSATRCIDENYKEKTYSHSCIRE